MEETPHVMAQWEKLTLAFVVIAIIFSFFFILRDDIRPVRNYPSDNQGIVAFGDSIIVGVGSESGIGLTGMLANRIGQNIINEGVSGNTTADGLERIDDVLRHEPKIVILSLGGNDALQNMPLERTEKNLDRIISQIQNEGSIVVLLGIRNGIFNDEFSSMYRELANRHQTALVTDILGGLFGDSRYMADAVHPNDAGYSRIAERVAPVIIDLNQ
tara:strand:- start:579 stop:1223 length:645 start_codon:yes stop_codon:yes gene_type:complete